MSESNSKTIFFDLGGVLINFSHEKMCCDLASLCHVDLDTIHSLLFKEGIAEEYERGLSTQTVYQLLRAKSAKSFDFQEFLQATSEIFSPKPEMIALLEQIKKQNTKLILLSNTCEAHFLYIKNHFKFLELFDDFILSYEIKARKPEEKIYQAALNRAHTSPKNCFYIDDILEYVQAAIKLGIESHHFQGIEGVKEALQQRGYDCS